MSYAEERQKLRPAFSDEARALAMQWRKLARAATIVAVLTSPATFIWLDVVAHRAIPRASLYGAEKPLLEEDVVARRRTWFWRTKWRRWTWIIGEPRPDAVDRQQHRQRDRRARANAIGHNIMGIAELLVGIGKIGKGSLAVRGAKKGEETAAEGTRAAKAKHAQLTAAEPATSLAGRGAAGHRAPWQQARHDGEVTQASERIETARQNLEAARHKLEVARELRDEGLKETSKEVAKGAAKVVAAEGAHLEPAQ